MEFTPPKRDRPLFRDNEVLRHFPDRDTVGEEVLREVLSRQRAYAIFIMQRSGSTWLGDLMRQTGLLGWPIEVLNLKGLESGRLFEAANPSDPAAMRDADAYAKATVRRISARTGAVGVQLSLYHAKTLCGMLPQPESWNDHVTFFYLRRRDIVAQAASAFRSRKMQAWHSFRMTRAERKAHAALEYDADAILEWISRLIEMEKGFEQYFTESGFDPIRLTYEDLKADTAGSIEMMAEHILGSAQYPRLRMARMRAGLKLLRPRTKVLTDAASRQALEAIRERHTAEIEALLGDRPPF